MCAVGVALSMLVTHAKGLPVTPVRVLLSFMLIAFGFLLTPGLFGYRYFAAQIVAFFVLLAILPLAAVSLKFVPSFEAVFLLSPLLLGLGNSGSLENRFEMKKPPLFPRRAGLTEEDLAVDELRRMICDHAESILRSLMEQENKGKRSKLLDRAFSVVNQVAGLNIPTLRIGNIRLLHSIAYWEIGPLLTKDDLEIIRSELPSESHFHLDEILALESRIHELVAANQLGTAAASSDSVRSL